MKLDIKAVRKGSKDNDSFFNLELKDKELKKLVMDSLEINVTNKKGQPVVHVSIEGEKIEKLVLGRLNTKLKYHAIWQLKELAESAIRDIVRTDERFTKIFNETWESEVRGILRKEVRGLLSEFRVADLEDIYKTLGVKEK